MSLAAPVRPLYAGPPIVPGFVVGEFLGRGSSAVVWAATSPAGARVALKVFSGDRAPTRRDEVLRDTARELTLSRRVSSDHVVAAHDRVELDDGRVVLVLDLAEEGSLHDVVTIRGALPLGEVVTMLIGVATGLADLETGGVVHGDVAPGNVLFDGVGRPVLADLSMARLVADGTSGDLNGTPGFTAPEVLAGRPPSPASDVWALGALLWYARTGGSTPPVWVGDVHWTPPGGPPEGPGVAEVVEAVGPELRPVLVRMLADDPYARPTATEAALAIYRAAPAEPVVLVGRHPDPAAAVTTRLRREAAETRSRRELRALQRATARSERRRASWSRWPWRSWRSWRSWRRGAAEAPPELEAARRASAPVAWAAPVSPDPEVAPGEAAPVPARGAWTKARVALVSTAGVLAAAGLLGLAALDRGSGPAPDHGDGATVVPSAAPVAGSASAPATPAPGASADAIADPTTVLQAIADARAAALAAADPVALVTAEREGSSAYAVDAATVARLREQRQRYRDLAFTVTAAQVVSVASGRAVVRATVGRSASTVEGEDGAVQSLAASPGEPLRYVLALTDGGWRLTDVTGS